MFIPSCLHLSRFADRSGCCRLAHSKRNGPGGYCRQSSARAAAEMVGIMKAKATKIAFLEIISEASCAMNLCELWPLSRQITALMAGERPRRTFLLNGVTRAADDQREPMVMLRIHWPISIAGSHYHSSPTPVLRLLANKLLHCATRAPA
jgi:hypothetical protein